MPLSHQLHICILFIYIQIRCSTSSYLPEWLPSQYVRCDQTNLVTTLTGPGNGGSLTFNFTFVYNSSFPTVPLLAYAVRSYHGKDYFGQERLYITKINQTTSEFSLNIRLVEATNFYLFNIGYITIDRTFPHLITAFENLQLNHSAGPLSNITDLNFTHPTKYTNFINFTQLSQSYSSVYTTFSAPFQRNKICLFTTSFYINGTIQARNPDPSIDNPLQIKIEAEPLNQSFFFISATVLIKVKVRFLDFCAVVFDSIDIMQSFRYLLISDFVEFSDFGGFLPMPEQLQFYSLLGFKDFSCHKTTSSLHFQLSYDTVGGVFGIRMPPSVGRSVLGNVPYRVKFSRIYMKAWICPNSTFLNYTTDVCTNCALQGCFTCNSLENCYQCSSEYHYYLEGTICQRCNVDSYYYFNQQTMTCEYCSPQACPRIQVQYQNCNSLLVRISNSTHIPILCQKNEVSIINQGMEIRNSKFIDNNQHNEWQLQVQIAYFRDIGEGQLIILMLGPLDKRVITHRPLVSLVYNTPQQCVSSVQIQTLTTFIQITSFIILFLALLSGKIIGLELFGVLQLAYFSLGSLPYWDLYLQNLSIFRITNGPIIKDMIEQKSAQTLPPQIKEMQISSYFINNYNILGFILMAWIILFSILHCISRRQTSGKTNRDNSGEKDKLIINMLKQGTVTLLIFSSIQIAYSAGIQNVYGLTDGMYFPLSLVFEIVVFGIVIFVMVLVPYTDVSGWGQFRDKFKETWTCQIYISVSIVYRLLIAGYLSSRISYNYSPLLCLGICIVFNMYFLINLPFKKYYHNYRSFLCHITQAINIAVINYYGSLMYYEQMQVKAHRHGPAILLFVMIFMCMLISGVVAVVDLVKFVSGYLNESKLKNKVSIEYSMSTIENI